MTDRQHKLHGRRKGRPLSAHQAELVERLLPTLLVDPSSPTRDDATALFPVPVDEVRLEVGCGAGEHLLHEAVAAPSVGFIGVEPFREGLAKIVAKIDAAASSNVRVFDDDAALVLDWLPEGSLTRIDLLYPDPWPKKRHWKRRFISAANLDRMARALRPGGHLRVASDISDYIDWTLRSVMPRSDFIWTARKADDWRLPWPGWPGTRYEAKALAAGRTPAYLTFRRV